MDFHQLKVHFIGIGGIGVSGLARFLRTQGAVVSGSDIVETTITQSLRKEGIVINIPHSSEVIKNKDLVIHSAIIKDSNVEIIESKRLGKQILSRKEALNFLLGNKKVLSICAAHGKSSTSAILASILPQSGAIIGAISKEFDSNVRVSKQDLLVFEADESDKSFLQSNPYKSIVINAEAEHLESYDHDFKKLQDAYLEFIKLSQHAVLNLECPTLLEIYNKLHSKDSSCIPKITCLNPSKDITQISYTLKNNRPYTTFNLLNLGEFSIYGIGYHNAINTSMAVLAALDILPLEEIKSNLANFIGIKKRFDILQDIGHNQPCIIDDYAHHPTEIRTTLSAVKIFAKLLQEQAKTQDEYKVTAIFQPHKYSRLRDNLDAFCACFKDCDSLVILPVWAAGEEKINFDFKQLFSCYNPTFASKVKREGKYIALLDQHGDLIKTLKSDIIIGLGAGDITYQLR